MMERTRKEGCLSDLALDRLLAAELPEAVAAAAREHLAGCADCAARREAIEVDRDAFRAAMPPLPERAAGARPVAPPAAPWSERLRRWLLPAGGLAVAVAAVLIFLVVRPDGGGGGAEPQGGTGTRIKGGERLGVYLKRGDVVSRAASGDPVQPGDGLGFTVTMTAARHVALIGRDSGHTIGVFFPEGARAEEVAAGVDTELPGSVTLDDVLGTEEFFAFFCDRPVAVAELTAALTGGGAPRVEGCRVDRVAFEKRAP